MKKFVKKCLLALGLIATVYVASGLFFAVRFGNQYSTGYPGALLDKINRLESINEPKIILVGDSNVAFGFRSKILEDTFGMPVVNLGMQHDLGNAFNERLALLNLNEGDIVILCNLDYNGDDRFISKELAWTYAEWNPSVWANMSLIDYWDLARAYPTYLKDAYKRHEAGLTEAYEDSAFSLYSFDEYGDNIYSVEHYQGCVMPTEDRVLEVLQDPSECSVKRINRMNKLVTDKGATLLIAGKPVLLFNEEDAADRILERCEAYDVKIREEFDCPVISSTLDYVYPIECFYDLYPHLNNEYAEARTFQLVSDLNRYFTENDLTIPGGQE